MVMTTMTTAKLEMVMAMSIGLRWQAEGNDRLLTGCAVLAPWTIRVEPSLRYLLLAA